MADKEGSGTQGTGNDVTLKYIEAMQKARDDGLDERIADSHKQWDADEAKAIEERRVREAAMQRRYEAENDDLFSDYTVELILVWTLVLIPLYAIFRFIRSRSASPKGR